MPFTHTLNPIIVSIGPLALRWYSLVYVLGFLLAYWLLLKAAKKKWIKNLDKEGVEEFMTSLIIWSVIMMRLVYVIVYNPTYYFAEPWKIIFLWEGGVSFHGGLLGGIIAGWLFCRKHKVRFFALADFLVIPFSLVLAFGRVANFINAELIGRVTSVNWCVNYPNQPEIIGCRHPSQFYEAGKNFIMFLVLGLLYTQKDIRKKLKEGTFFWAFFILYGLGRFLTDFYRAPDPTDFTLAATGLIVGQWLSMLMAAIGVAGLLWLYLRKR
ncbi:prolipoprotein diacylglyceryl transferase [Candidatus Woesearchaeota archaeon]|nr:prolipoprotein diacylglyceryl transferase [Candidatus Woesearchaeota archaeon]